MNIFIEHLERISLLPHQKVELMILSAQTFEALGDDEYKPVAVFLRDARYIYSPRFLGEILVGKLTLNLPGEVLDACLCKMGWMEVLRWAIAQVKNYQRDPLSADEQHDSEGVCDLFIHLQYNSASMFALLKFCLKRFEFDPELEYHAMLDQWCEPTRFLDKPFDDEFQEQVWQQISPSTRDFLQCAPLSAWQFLAIGEWAFANIETRIMGKMESRFKEAIAGWKALHRDS
jgi:hypothetical protein